MFFLKKDHHGHWIAQARFPARGEGGGTTGTLRPKGVPFPRPQHFISRSIQRGSLKGLIVYNYPPVEGEVSNGVDIPRREASRYTPEGDSLFY